MKKNILIHILILLYSLTFFSCKKDTIKPSDFGLIIKEDTININEDTDFFNVCFYNEKVGIITNTLSDLYLTTDGNETWNYIGEGIDGSIRSMCFLDSSTIIVAKSAIYKSYNRGIDWILLGFENTTSTFFDIEFINMTTGFVCKNAKIYKTINGGINWMEVFPKDSEGLPGFQVISGIIFPEKNNIGYAFGGASISDYGATYNYGTLLKTIDYGENWEKVDLQIEQINAIYFWNNQEGIIFPYNHHILYTEDGGESWETINTSFPLSFPRVHFFNSNKGIACDQKKILVTVDKGKTWTEVYNTRDDITAISSPNSNYCIVVGRDQILLWISELK